jgi:hypothetical protein
MSYEEKIQLFNRGYTLWQPNVVTFN